MAKADSAHLHFNRQILDCVVGGVSALDIPRLNIRSVEEAKQFVLAYGYNLDAAEGRKYRPLFDEVGYLAMNPEIAKKVKSGTIPSGVAYYIANARRLNFDMNHVVAKN